jgi:hypothetical protein
MAGAHLRRQPLGNLKIVTKGPGRRNIQRAGVH